MSSSLARSAASGAVFTLGAQAVKIVLQLASVVVLSRLLTPHDYGLIAIVLVVIGIGEIFRDFGLTSATIQAPELSEGQRDNLFWINAGLGLGLAVIMFGMSWPLQVLTGEDDLLPIVQVLSCTFVLNGLTTQYRAQLMRALRFRATALIDIVAAALALGAAVVSAILGAGYGALVLQQIVNGLVLLAGAVIAGRWIPRLYSRQHRVAGLVRFGWNLVATNLLSYAGNQIDTILVAARFGTVPLGTYNRAFQLVMTPLAQVRSPLSNVAIPVLSRVQQDPARFDAFVISGQLALGYALGTPLLLLAGLADPVAHIMLGPQWGETVPIIRLFAVTALLTTLAFVGYWVYVARGLGAQLFRYTMVSLAIRVVCIGTGSFFGLLGVAIGVAVAPALAWPLSLFWLSRITPVPVRSLYGGAFRVMGLTFVAGAVAWWASSGLGSGWTALLAGIAAGLVAAGAFLILPAYRRDARSLVGFARLLLDRRRD
ncbi:lipopolysaccharide biosynthesis protein [Microbacterium tumbae]